ncbi:MAG: pyruvate:ferredoxin (flavodoxin) oxidoreductase [Acidimicrobiales bacterium]|nr:pyruvate:ferredoxin (flavodoxin) oxidoreductase [Acidimicrobiales bacterium]
MAGSGTGTATGPSWTCVDGNEAAAEVAYALSEVISIYPITPASAMGELADAWSASSRPNAWGNVPEVIEMQSEAGAAGALHGALQRGALATTFTASQGLLLMLPNMFKIAGELTPAVIHVAARAIATHALSIFGDHSDVMAARSTGFALLSSGSVQEAQDLALVAHAATLRSRVPFLHFFDGFRTSHEVNRIERLTVDDLLALVAEDDILAHRARRLDPNRPVLRGSAQNPDVFFQAREACSPYYAAVPAIVQDAMDRLAERTGRPYALVELSGHPEPERLIVLMGSAAGAVGEAVDALVAEGERVALAQVRLFRPFPVEAFLAAVPASVRSIAVLDRTKEPGSVGEPLFQDVITALAEAVATGARATMPRVIGGRYGLASKEFNPAMAKAVFDELGRAEPRARFTVGIVDDVSHSSLEVDPTFMTDRSETRAVFYALGSDGTVGANKNSVKIIGEQAGLFAQGYFVYDSKKAGAVTVSHLRFSSSPIRSTYLIDQADLVACHQFHFLDRIDVLSLAKPGASFLLNSPYGPDEVWEHLPEEVQHQILDKGIELWVVDAHRLAGELGMGGRINTVMQPCFFALAGILPAERAVEEIKRSIEKTYGHRGGQVVVERNFEAVDRALQELHRVEVPAAVAAGIHRRPVVPPEAPDFVQRVTARMLAGEGDLLPVSALPVDGTFPTATARWERRSLARELPIWDPDICIDCGKCAIVCPHAAIRMKVFPVDDLPAADGFLAKDFRSRDLPGHLLTIQVAPDDCTGCGVCVDTCPAKSKEAVKHKAINMEPADEHRDAERARFDAFLTIPELDRSLLDPASVKGSQVLEPLFEFSGACAGCGETPYLKLLSQLFGDRMVVANATGCSSIYGGNLPTTPWSVNAEGRGPAWANSLFEDNAEFGLGLRLGLEGHQHEAHRLLTRLAPAVDHDLASDLLEADQSDEAGIAAQRRRVAKLRDRLAAVGGDEAVLARRLASIADDLVRTSVWIVGGDGWAYDIGYGGLDHVLASGRDVNILVLDTEVYSNTGGQASKATPRGAVAKFAMAGKSTGKKDLGAVARAYGHVFVAQIAMGGSDVQAVKALLEADAWPGPSLVIAYSTCIAHGIDMTTSMAHQRDAVRSGYWPLYRFQPGVDEHTHPFHLDSHAPSLPLRDFTLAEARFAMLARSDPLRAERLLQLAQADVDERWRYYEQLAGMERTVPHSGGGDEDGPAEGGLA